MRWDDVDRTVGELRLRDAKSDQRMVPLTEPVSVVLAGIQREPGNPWVIVGRKPGTRLSSLRQYWYSIREKAGLGDVRLHDCRHSYASRALALGESLPTIGKPTRSPEDCDDGAVCAPDARRGESGGDPRW